MFTAHTVDNDTGSCGDQGSSKEQQRPQQRHDVHDIGQETNWSCKDKSTGAKCCT